MAEQIDIRARAAGSEPFARTEAALTATGATAWFVGGAVRDLLIGREVKDVDLAVAGDAREIAHALHKELGGDIFTLSDRFGTWRVMPDEGDWQIDLTGLRGETIGEDLALRDFAVNAIAFRDGETVDPFDGAGDAAKKVLRVLGEQAYLDDPLRPLRLPRLAASLGFEVDAATAELTKKHAAGVTEAAPERAFAELRGLLCSADPLRGLELLDEFGLTEVLLPELSALQGVEQSVYHHLDAYGHTLEVLERYVEIEADPAAVFGDHGAALAGLLAEPIADEMTRGEALRWAALLHDIAKSETRVELPDGRIGFPGHDKRGAEIVRAICKRFKTSERFSHYVAALTRHHLRLGFLVHARPLPKRDVYRYLRACEPVEVEVGVLSVADRLATRGRKSEAAIAAHLELAVELTENALDWRANPRAALVRGDDLAESLGVKPGRVIGAALDAIAEEQYIGSVTDRDEAVALAKRLYADGALTP